MIEGTEVLLLAWQVERLLLLLSRMETRTRLTFALLGALVLGACSNAGMTNDGPSTMQLALTDARIENNHHLSGCQGADSLVSMLDELGRHDSTMTPLMDRMDGAHGHMTHCSGGNFDGLARSIADMHTAMSDHDQRMRNTSTLEAAQSECSAHVDAMDTMTQDMMDDLTGMSCMMGG